MPTNDAAAGLAVGSAVVNTAGGLGGPRGATRGHERLVRFPDPHDAPEVVERLRHRLCAARPEGAVPPVVFAGWARPLLRNDPRMPGCRRRAVRCSGGSAGSGGGRRADDRGGAAGSGGRAQPGGPRAGSGGGDAAGDGRPEHRRAPSAGHRGFVMRPVAGAPARWPPRCRRAGRAVIRPSTVDGPGLLTAAAGPTIPTLPGGLRAGRAWWPGAAAGPAARSCCGRVRRQAGTCSGWWRTVPPFAGLFEPAARSKAGHGARSTCRARSLPRSSGIRCSGGPGPDGWSSGTAADDRGRVLVPFADEEDQP